jgi:FixJ family two-component response regulator
MLPTECVFPVVNMSVANAPICLLDDDASVLRSIARLLKSDDLEALTFERAADFLAHAQQHEVQVAVLDIHMPEMSGLDVHTRLREISPKTRVIFITGFEKPGLRASALQNGVHAFLLKPFDDEVFLRSVHRALERAA